MKVDGIKECAKIFIINSQSLLLKIPQKQSNQTEIPIHVLNSSVENLFITKQFNGLRMYFHFRTNLVRLGLNSYQ